MAIDGMEVIDLDSWGQCIEDRWRWRPREISRLENHLSRDERFADALVALAHG